MGAYAHFTAVDRGNHKAHQLKKFFPQCGVGHDAHFELAVVQDIAHIDKTGNRSNSHRAAKCDKSIKAVQMYGNII
jgi:hypothetical protein